MIDILLEEAELHFLSCDQWKIYIVIRGYSRIVFTTPVLLMPRESNTTIQHLEERWHHVTVLLWLPQDGLATYSSLSLRQWRRGSCRPSIYNSIGEKYIVGTQQVKESDC